MHKRVFSFEDFLTEKKKLDFRKKKENFNVPCSICLCIGHTEKFCEKPKIKIILPGYEMVKQCLFYSSENNWKQGRKMEFNQIKNQWEIQRNFKFGRW